MEVAHGQVRVAPFVPSLMVVLSLFIVVPSYFFTMTSSPYKIVMEGTMTW
jgi:hypothetical protein